MPLQLFAAHMCDPVTPLSEVCPGVPKDLEAIIMRCLEKTGGNKRQAARLLNLSRTTFIDKLHRLNMERGAA